ncbi:PQQ-dependent sugar dehydrogenase [Rhodovibrionaceae bacterium A322]
MTQHFSPLPLRPFCVFTLLLVMVNGLVFEAEARTFKSEKQSFSVTEVTDGLEHPWAMAFLPDGGILITERPGRLRLWRDGQLLPEPVEGLPALVAKGQGGLLDIVLHPRFEETGWLYLSYSANDLQGSPQNKGTRVSRHTWEDGKLSPGRIIYDLEKKTSGGRHFGSRLAFDDEAHLYITIGDRGDQPRAQDLGDAAGSVLRLKDNGRIPEDNPFVGQAGADPAIYSYGHRNPQGLIYHSERREIWDLEHGPKGGDEINKVVAGGNFGWPLVSFGVNYSGTPVGTGESELPGLEPPLYHWTPSIAPSGMALLTSDAYPGWQGNLFVGSLKFQLLSRLELDGDQIVHEEQLLSREFGRIRDVRQGPDGLLYLLTDAPNGKLLRLDPR